MADETIARRRLRGFGNWQATATRHTPLEDAQGLFTGTVLTALGISILAHLGLLTGGTAGLAFILHYATGWNFGLLFFVVNLPFYFLAVRRMGLAFTVKTFVAVALLSLLTAVQPALLAFGTVDRTTGAVLGGLLMGFGLLALFRHRTSLGGVGILALYLQDRFHWRAGLTQLAIDLSVLALSFTVADPVSIAFSILGVVVLNLFLAINHRADRYIAM
ncbi:membrane protein [Aureimonas sp. SA4125]|uniref:YitT family protein n=1 Tax=Aureimonas sp. SA4125 TaxID=2826993 RepID=UPI001CC3C57C|nr:YitT family protein [Aureimonas sp. SA4125]BDA83201.1 membrane protein [Aureimonas sp. SA4125]